MGMADVGEKEATEREAVAGAVVYLKERVIKIIKKRKLPKGDVLEAARLAGILAAKKTPTLIPLCHPIPIEYVDVDFLLGKNFIKIITTVKARAKTGVEMEALTATAIAALTIYDMCKPIDRDMTVSEMRLLKKTGGKSGTYIRNPK